MQSRGAAVFAAGVLQIIGSAPPAQAAPLSGTDMNWAQKLRSDARAMHDILAHDHPGTVDARNPGFARTLRAGLQQALQRTSKTTDRGGWYWAMKEFAAGFDDAHL